MATEDAGGSFSHFNTILSDLQHTNKAKRKKAFDEYYKLVFEDEESVDKGKLDKILEFSLSLLVTSLGDPSEVIRMKVSIILLKFIDECVVSECQLVDIIPVIHHRLGVVPVMEESEDVRLLLVNIIMGLTLKFEAKMIPYMNDVVNILKESVVDRSPDVRKAASECVRAYTRATREKFHMQSESLVKPLLKALTHQRFKNRISCLNALGDLLLYGDSKIIQDVSGPLAQCAMDLPQVREALVEVGGALALNMPDRYSYWHRILPLILFGLRDDDDDVRQKAEELWVKVGLKYEEENIDHLKQDIDFDVTLENYPEGEKRPSVGCRVLVQRAIYHILPGLMTDMDDWQAGPRLQAAKLLTVLILNADVGITQYAEKVLVGLHLAAGDKEKSVVKQVTECSRYLGHFIPPSTYLPLILPRLNMGEQGERPLTILAALVEGTASSQLQDNVKEIMNTVASEGVAFVSHHEHQGALLQLTQVIITKCDVSESSFDIFHILLFVASSSEVNCIVNSALNQLDILARKTGCAETGGLYRKHLHATFKTLLPSASCWTETTPQFLMFVGLMELAGQAIGYELELFVQLLTECVPRKHDSFVSLRCLTKLRGLLLHDDHPLESHDQLGQWLPILLSECIAVLLPWHAGRTADTLRTASVACLEAVCRVCVREARMVEELKKCSAIIPALIEDDAEDTRLFTCDVIYAIIVSYPQIIDSETLHIFADKLVKRFDDVAPQIRLKAARVLAELFNNLPNRYDPILHTARLQDLYDAAVIFLDDPDAKLQEAVLFTLEKMGSVCPGLLITTLEKDLHKYRNAHYCRKLIDSLKALQVT
ncbi:dynein axonemal assembly factor 5-like [Homarus americanus]|uniref:dynein axonemal assembly factor 5-like n=1 Tax=Homarus americanus TaxID=6706 RepID=UPI001C466E45|nr:dynein axonemal assembly factor 5-like [Homarus americanus]